MKPIKLKFYGLNSFIKPQEIDFTKLTTGVFGIFGKTGSGKTTILDAIMLSLYGQISKNTKAVDFINSKCDETGVELVFKTGDGEDKTYFVERKEGDYELLFNALISVIAGTFMFTNTTRTSSFILGTGLLIFTLLMLINKGYLIYKQKNKERSR